MGRGAHSPALRKRCINSAEQNRQNAITGAKAPFLWRTNTHSTHLRNNCIINQSEACLEGERWGFEEFSPFKQWKLSIFAMWFRLKENIIQIYHISFLNQMSLALFCMIHQSTFFKSFSIIFSQKLSLPLLCCCQTTWITEQQTKRTTQIKVTAKKKKKLSLDINKEVYNRFSNF